MNDASIPSGRSEQHTGTSRLTDHEIPLSRPDLSRIEENLVLEVMRSGRLSMGPMQERFEQAVAARAGCSQGVAVSSGTAGLHCVVRALGLGPGDEVITTPFSFVASTNCLLFGGVKPVFVDICPKTLNMDPAAVEAAITPKTKAILAVEAFGNPTHMDRYAAIAAKHELPLIEDCCEALGTVHKGRPCGSFGRIGVFGFYPNKQITTGEGGLIVTDDERLADLCRSFRNQGRGIAGPPGANRGGWLLHERLGYNYRLSELNAAVGLGQIRRLDELMEARARVVNWYIERLMGHAELTLPNVDPATSLMSWFVFVVRLSTDYGAEERDRVIRGLRNHEIGAADYFPCIHRQPYLAEAMGVAENAVGRFPIAESVSTRTMALPLFTSMTEREVDLVVQTLDLMLSREHLTRA